MTPGFTSRFLDVRTQDGLNDVLLSTLDYVAADGKTIYRCPIGGTTDGLSVPKCVQNIIPATGGDWFSGVLHDSAYRNQLLVYAGNESWSIANLSQAQCDALILEAMGSQLLLDYKPIPEGATVWEKTKIGFENSKISVANGRTHLQIQTIYRALRMFGRFAFADNRSAAGIIRNQLQAV